MSDAPNPIETDAERKARRSKLLGRLLIVLLGLLLVAQMIPFMMRS